MTIPLLAYFYIMSTKRWIRAAIVVSIATVRRVCAGQLLERRFVGDYRDVRIFVD